MGIFLRYVVLDVTGPSPIYWQLFMLESELLGRQWIFAEKKTKM